MALRAIGEPPAGLDLRGVRCTHAQKVWLVRRPGLSFQTTFKPCGESVAIAERVLLLCMARFEAGDSKEQVLAYREKLYAQVQELMGGAGASKGSSNAKGGPSPEDLEAAALRMLGEPAGNSPYVVHTSKLGMCHFVYPGPPRVRFQTTYQACGDSIPVAERVLLHCYTRFAEGDSKEQVLEYRRDLYEKVTGVLGKVDRKTGALGKVDRKRKGDAETSTAKDEPEQAKKAKKAKPPREAGRKAKKAKPQREAATSASEGGTASGGGTSSDDDSSSDSSSSSSAKVEQLEIVSVDQQGGGATANGPVANGPAANGLAANAGGAPERSPLLGLPRSGLACGKVLVRSGLRCACHFMPRERCPG